MRPIIFLLLLTTIQTCAQPSIEVADLTFKLKSGANDTLYFGFAAGDQVIFSFEETDGKGLKEVTVFGFPRQKIYAGYEISQLIDKSLVVLKESVLGFTFQNANLAKAKVVHVVIHRVPAQAATEKFDTKVHWIEKIDTTWGDFVNQSVIEYDTTFNRSYEWVYDHTEQEEIMVMDKSQRVHSLASLQNVQTFLSFKLPQNQSTDEMSTKVGAWAYWIGVGKESNDAWQQNKKAISKSVETIAGYAFSPLGALAAGVVVNLSLPSMGEDVSYELVSPSNHILKSEKKEYIRLDYGKGVGGYKRFSDPAVCQGTYYVEMENDNYIQEIDVNLKVSAIIEKKINRKIETVIPIVHEKTVIKSVRTPILKPIKVPTTSSQVPIQKKP